MWLPDKSAPIKDYRGLADSFPPPILGSSLQLKIISNSSQTSVLII